MRIDDDAVCVVRSSKSILFIRIPIGHLIFYFFVNLIYLGETHG
jgi:hypothetical protein